MKIMSWNVNGIRSVMKKGFSNSIKIQNPDILCLQEIKANVEQVDKLLEEYPSHTWNSADKKGYSGTAIFSKEKPISVKLGKELLGDTEGRVIVAEYSNFYLVNVYTPNSQRGLARLSHRIQWDKKFLPLLQKLEKNKPVIFCGDLNVAHTEIDIARPKENLQNPGFTLEERKEFDEYIKHGFIDTFRHLHPNLIDQYTWWSYMHEARAKNIGWRIDYICTSQSLKNSLKKAEILPHINGSDHCPVTLDLTIK